jgi:hypothetical protein
MTATLLEVKKFFDFASASEFTAQWKELNADEQNAIREGIGDGSLNY